MGSKTEELIVVTEGVLQYGERSKLFPLASDSNEKKSAQSAHHHWVQWLRTAAVFGFGDLFDAIRCNSQRKNHFNYLTSCCLRERRTWASRPPGGSHRQL